MTLNQGDYRKKPQRYPLCTKTKTVSSSFSVGHHKGTEAEFASLSYFPGPCESDQELSEIEALKLW